MATASIIEKLPSLSLKFSLENPTDSEDRYLFRTPVAITITEMVCTMRGSLPTLTWTIRFAADRSAAGTEVVTGGTASTNTTTGDVVTVFNDATIPADSHIWIETTAQGGTADEAGWTIEYTEDDL